MTPEAYLSAGLFIGAISINSATVYLQKQHNIYYKLFKAGHRAHCIVLTTAWLPFFLSLFWLEFSESNVYKIPVVGWLLFLMASMLFWLSYTQIGMDGLTNKDIFTNKKKKLTGVYKYVPGPMYLSYTLLLLGWGLKSGVAGFYVLSIISVIGLQIIEAKIESIPNKNNNS